MRILLTLTDSPECEKLLDYGAEITAAARSGSTYLTVIPAKDPPASRRILDMARAALPAAAFQEKIRRGTLRGEVLAEAQEGEYDLVILASPAPDRGDSLQVRTMLTEIVEGAPCSVLVVKNPAGPIKRVLLCDSGSSEAAGPREFTSKLIQALKSLEGIAILHVMSQVSAGPGIPGLQLRSDAENMIRSHTPEGLLLERDIQELARAGLQPVPIIRHGLVVDEILEESRSGDYDLVVIGAHGPAGWQRVLLENLARKIVNKVDRPILIVKSSPGH